MTDTKLPEALRLANCLQDHVVTYPQLSEDEPGGYCGEVDKVMDESAAELRRLHTENTTLQQGYDAARLEIEARNKQLVKEAARTAEEKLRADRMTEQHRMQCQMREGLEREIEVLRKERGLWQQESHPPTRLCGCKDCAPSFEGESPDEYPPMPWGSDFEEWLEVRSESAVHDAFRAYVDADRAMQAQAAPAPTTEQAAHDMGAKGAPATEAERLLFEAWMRGHCWALSATWNGKEYRSDSEHPGHVDPLAMRTRGLWAAWRDRAALAAAPQPPVAAQEPAASVYTMEALVPGAHAKCHATLHKPLPAGTKLYTHPAPQPAPVAQGDAARLHALDLARAALLTCTKSGYTDVDGDFHTSYHFEGKAVSRALEAIDAARAQAKEGGAA